MNYEKIILKKNKILCLILTISIILRCIVNAFFTNITAVIEFSVAGMLIMGIISFLAFKVIKPIYMMYVMVIFMFGLCLMCMFGFPCVTNYLMFFQPIFLVVLYENFYAIFLECILCIGGLILSYTKYQSFLEKTWSLDSLVLSILYIGSGIMAYVALCNLTKKSFNELKQTSHENTLAKEKTDLLLSEIVNTIDTLSQTNTRIKDSIQSTNDISINIADSSKEIASRMVNEVQSVEEINSMVEESVDRLHDVIKASNKMTSCSLSTKEVISDSTTQSDLLAKEMLSIDSGMSEIVSAIRLLGDENSKISQILSTLEEITTQTNLLSLNASIEAARAGEHGRGFAVVAEEIRVLADNSSKFTEQISQILNGINEKTEKVTNEILNEQEAINRCNTYAQKVNNSFVDVNQNTGLTLEHSQKVDTKTNELENIITNTKEDVQAINETIDLTSSTMQKILSYSDELTSNFENVVTGYNDINNIVEQLSNVTNK